MEIINNFISTIHEITFEEYWAKLLDCNLISTKNRTFFRKKISETLNKGSKQDKETIHLYYSGFELEFNNFGDSYTFVLSMLAQESDGLFNPENIIENETASYIFLSFESKNKKFECNLHKGRVCDSNIFWLVNKALKAAKSKELVASFFAGWNYQDEYVNYGFVNKDAYRKMIKSNLVPDFNDNMFFAKKAKVKFDDYLSKDDFD